MLLEVLKSQKRQAKIHQERLEQLFRTNPITYYGCLL